MAEDNNNGNLPPKPDDKWSPNESVTTAGLNSATVRSGLGELDRALTDAFLGPNIRGQASPLPGNKDTQGYLFITRPRLNLSYNNAVNIRKLKPFVDAGRNTLMRALRVSLDPVSQVGGSIDHIRTHGRSKAADENVISGTGTVESPLIDPLSPFLDYLSNTLTEMSGFPDESTDTYTSDVGVGAETFSMVDGYARNYGNFDLTLNFKNVDGDPVTGYATIMREYMHGVQSGAIVPWPDSLIEFEMDYYHRFYRIVLDKSKRKIRKIGSAFGFPLLNPIAGAFNYNNERPYSEDNDTLSIPYRCVGAEYNDPIIMDEFNDSVFMFNPGLENSIVNGTDEYVRLSPQERVLFKQKVYPYIDVELGELVWYTPKENYEQVIAVYGV